MKRQYVDISGTSLHYIVEGEGTPLILLAGWPQSIYAWRKVIPHLSQHYQVIAVDLPGMGHSSIPAPSYDTDSIAALIHEFLINHDISRAYIMTHDIGTWVAYSYASQFPDTVIKLVLMDGQIPGNSATPSISVDNAPMLWHFGFNMIEGLAELLTAGREYDYLSWFFKNRSVRKNAFDEKDIQYYVELYSRPKAMMSGFSYYRALAETIQQNKKHALKQLMMPILTIGGDTHAVGLI